MEMAVGRTARVGEGDPGGQNGLIFSAFSSKCQDVAPERSASASVCRP